MVISVLSCLLSKVQAQPAATTTDTQPDITATKNVKSSGPIWLIPIVVILLLILCCFIGWKQNQNRNKEAVEKLKIEQEK